MEAGVAYGAHVPVIGRSVAAQSCSSNGAARRFFFARFPLTFRSHIASLKPESCEGRRFGVPGGRNGASVFLVRAGVDGENAASPIAPLQPESPTGQFLTQLLQSHPHLFTAAAEHELERLAENRQAEDSQGQPKPSGTELVLYRRIAELKARERQKALEEIIYTLVVQKFVESGVAMLPDLSCLTSIAKPWPPQIKELESVHSGETLEMIQEHLALVLGGRGASDYLDQNMFAQISKLRVGQVYVASIIYGYFLRRVYNRFQLEKSMKLLSSGTEETISREEVVSQADEDIKEDDQPGTLTAETAAAMAVLKGAFTPAGVKGKPSKLRSYIMSLDVETLHRSATVRAKESLSVLEKHTEALFGRPEIHISPDGSMKVNNDEVLKVSFAGLKRSVLEAVAFGSFLWDVETYVDSCYSFVTN